MYKHLETNIPNHIMEYKGFPFPEGTPMFPKRSSVLEYVQNYSNTFLKDRDEIFLSLETLVEEVRKDDTSGKWILTTKSLSGDAYGRQESHSFDAVIICSGHYSVPYIPNVDGLKEWAAKDPSSISHAKYFNDGEAFKNKRVLVIGNAASGMDISTQLIVTAKTPIYRSIKSDTSSQPITKSIKDVAEVVKYDHITRSVTLKDGETISDIDRVLFCTGYLYSIPYLKSYISGDDAIITDGSRIHRLYKQMFYIPDPSLITVGMQWKIIPMPMAESQGAIIARVLSGRLRLPQTSQMLLEEQKEVEVNGDGRQFHCYQFPKDYEYTKELHNWANTTKNNSEFGFMAELWDEEKQNTRASSFEIKNEYFKAAILSAELSRKRSIE